MDETHAFNSSVIALDLYCVCCGYNLRTQNLEASCPECGTAVQESILDDADLSWLRRIRDGVTVLLFAYGLSTLISLLWIVFVAFSFFSLDTIKFLNPLYAFMGICHMTGALMVARSPAGVRFSELGVFRFLIRLGLIGGVGQLIFQFAGIDLMIGTTILIYFMLSLVYWAWGCVILYYMYSLLAALQVKARTWWILAIGLLTAACILSQINLYSIYAFKSPFISNRISLTLHGMATLTCMTFYHFCRSELAKVMANCPSVAPDASQHDQPFVQSHR